MEQNAMKFNTLISKASQREPLTVNEQWLLKSYGGQMGLGLKFFCLAPLQQRTAYLLEERYPYFVTAAGEKKRVK
jgi:hypothetical protein